MIRRTPHLHSWAASRLSELRRAGWILRGAFAVAVLASQTGCTYVYENWPNFVEHPPRSILALPPINKTDHAAASDRFLAVLAYPIAEKGYYAYPPMLVKEVLRREGVEAPEEAHALERERLRELFGADAVLYTTVHEWTPYKVVKDPYVRVSARLIDVETGLILWHQSDQGQAPLGPADVAVYCLVPTAPECIHFGFLPWTSWASFTMSAAAQASYGLLLEQHYGLLYGPYHPKYAEDLDARRRQIEAGIE